MSDLSSELLWKISESCSWSSLVALNATNRRFRRLIQEFICRRVKTFLVDFLPVDAVVTLFGLLRIHEGVIIGPIVRCIMSVHTTIYRRINPRQLDIILPSSSAWSSLQELLMSNGYLVDHTGRVDSRLSVGYKTFKKFLLFDGSRVVCILSTRTQATLRGLLMSQLSSQLFALSPTRIYCFYPELFAREEFVVLRNDCHLMRGIPFEEFNFGLTGIGQASVPDMKCGESCPVLWRKASSAGGVEVVRWGGINGLWDGGMHVTPRDPFFIEGGPFMWRRADMIGCGNKFCVNVGRTMKLDSSY
ncbi:hypothetical protein CVT25_013478 [Psilocybe cyanescens]|uniref:F-box domain-containing protein n=1 Tax=Psilocybe cyanescens TaxID=93625 RepID=A0A409W0P2_PSICY|nr:hypothetical protein CVT25_013478 [Psilocybe cyanescens]